MSDGTHMKPVAYRQMSSKWHCWVFEENRGDLRPDDEAEGLVLQSDAQMLLEALIALHAVATVQKDEDYAAVTNAASAIARATAQQPTGGA